MIPNFGVVVGKMSSELHRISCNISPKMAAPNAVQSSIDGRRTGIPKSSACICLKTQSQRENKRLKIMI